jgi:hypothetical protein
MRKYQFKCQHCGVEFMAERSNTKYCSDSCRTMASRKRAEQDSLVNGTEEITIEYSSKEIKQLQTEADFTGLPLEQFIKLKSLLTKTRINDNKNKVQQLTEEINRLKVRLSLYTNESSDGIYIKVDRELKAEIFEEMSNSFPDMTIDEAITYVVLNYNEDIEDAKRFEQKKAKEIIASNKIKNYEDCSKILFDKMAKLLKRKKIS